MIYSDLNWFIDIPLLKIAQEVKLSIKNPLLQIDINSINRIKEYVNNQNKNIILIDKTYFYTYKAINKSFLTIDTFFLYEIPSNFNRDLSYDFELWKKLKKRNNQIEYAIQFRNHKKVLDYLKGHLPITEKIDAILTSQKEYLTVSQLLNSIKIIFKPNESVSFSEEQEQILILLFPEAHQNFLNNIELLKDGINFDDIEEKDQNTLVDLMIESRKHFNSINLMLLNKLNKINTVLKDKVITFYFENRFRKISLLNKSFYEIELFDLNPIPQHLIDNYMANNMTPFFSGNSIGKALQYINSDYIPNAFRKYLYEKFLSSLSESLFDRNPEYKEELLFLWYRQLISQHIDIFVILEKLNPSKLNDLLLIFMLEKIKLSEDHILLILNRFYNNIPSIITLPYITQSIQFYYLYKGFSVEKQNSWFSFYNYFFHPSSINFLSTNQLERINTLVSQFQETNFSTIHSLHSGEGLYAKYERISQLSVQDIKIEHHTGNNPSYWASWTEIRGDDGEYNYYEIKFSIFNNQYSFKEDENIPNLVKTIFEVKFFMDLLLENKTIFKTIDDVTYLTSVSGFVKLALFPQLTKIQEAIINLSKLDHFLYLSSNNTLFFWGGNDYGQLGDGTTVNKSLPCKFSYFDNKIIVVSKVLIANDKTCILTKDHRVYFFGKSIIEDDSQNKNSHIPIDISSAFSLRSDDLYISISLFFDGFSAITKSGRLFLWQDKQIKTIGGVINKNFPFLIEITSLFNLLENDKIVQFSQGFNHFGVITLLGQLFLWGNNDFGQLGTINHTSFNEPHNITYNLPLEFNDKVLIVSCGNGFTSFLTKFGRLFLCGNNEFGQIGIGKKNPYFTNIIEITNSFKLSSNDKLVNVKSYGNFNYALTSIGRLFVWGKSPYLIINNSSKIINSPFEVTSLFNINKNDQIVDIEFFETYALVKTKDDQTLLWTVDKIIHE
jgi:hypothetical protein